MARRRHRRALVPPPPWSPEEDQHLREVNAIGLSSDFWHVAFPTRTFGEIASRRLDLRLPRPRDL